MKERNKPVITSLETKCQESPLKICSHCSGDSFANFVVFSSKTTKDSSLKICVTCGRGYPLNDNSVLTNVNHFYKHNVSVNNIDTCNEKPTSDVSLNTNRLNPVSSLSTYTNTASPSKQTLSPENVIPTSIDTKELSSCKSTTKDASENRGDNEFSDHSDGETFGQLPKSLFEAIEDTQDDRHQPSNHRLDRNKKEKLKRKARACPICGKVYTASSSYFYHKKHFHGQAREHRCDVCNKQFVTRADLAQHGSVHSSERGFACGACGARFGSRAARYVHEQTHGSTRAHECARCGRAFRWRAHLRRHELRHAGAREHACGACGRAFAVRADLLRHARTHTAGCHACDTCHVIFAQLRYLKAHKRKKHGERAAPET